MREGEGLIVGAAGAVLVVAGALWWLGRKAGQVEAAKVPQTAQAAGLRGLTTWLGGSGSPDRVTSNWRTWTPQNYPVDAVANAETSLAEVNRYGADTGGWYVG